jgi:cell wall-associated NlpC family hydrolase
MRREPIGNFRLLMLLGLALVAGGCASSGAVPRPFPTPGDDSPIAAPAPAPTAIDPATGLPTPAPPAGAADGYTLRGTALSLRGAPYRNGGATPDGFDCSGFVQYVFGRHGLTMPRETREQFRVGRGVSRAQLAPGDLVFFTTVAPGASHVGIVIDRDQFVHAPSTRGVVRIERLSADYWDRRFIGARRAY